MVLESTSITVTWCQCLYWSYRLQTPNTAHSFCSCLYHLQVGIFLKAWDSIICLLNTSNGFYFNYKEVMTSFLGFTTCGCPPFSLSAYHSSGLETVAASSLRAFALISSGNFFVDMFVGLSALKVQCKSPLLETHSNHIYNHCPVPFSLFIWNNIKLWSHFPGAMDTIVIASHKKLLEMKI